MKHKCEYQCSLRLCKIMSFHSKLSLGNDHITIYRLLFLPLKLVVNCQIASQNWSLPLRKDCLASYNNRILSSPVLQKSHHFLTSHIKRPYWRNSFEYTPKLTPTLFLHFALYLVVICKWIYFSFFYNFSEVSGSIGLVGYHQCQGVTQ